MGSESTGSISSVVIVVMIAAAATTAASAAPSATTTAARRRQAGRIEGSRPVRDAGARIAQVGEQRRTERLRAEPRHHRRAPVAAVGRVPEPLIDLSVDG